MNYKKKNKKRRSKNENLPYEKFLRFGPQALTESELLAIILRTGTKNKTALQMAEEVLSMSDPKKEGLLGLYDIPLEKLMEIKGIGEVKAVKVKCLTEFSARISASKAKEGLIVNRPETVAQYFMEGLRHRKTECVMVACMDSKGEMIKETMLSTGSVKMSVISPREIYMEALKSEAVNIILVHNHPSGDPSPSKSDILLTKNVAEMGLKMDIPLLDHIIIGDNRYISFKEAGLL